MADLTYEILSDRDQYPDDQEITLSNGKTVTVKQFRDALMPKADMTKLSEGWKQKERQLVDAVNGSSQQVQELTQKLEQALKERAPAPREPGRGTQDGTISEADLLADPVLGVLARQLKSANETNAKLTERLDAHEKTLGEYRNAWIQGGFRTQLERLKGRADAKDLKDPDWNTFLDYVKKKPVIDAETGLADLEATYTNWAAPRLLEEARKAGEQTGLEKGKAAARVPRVPSGRRASPPKGDGVPATFQEVTDQMIENDGDLQAIVRGEAEGLPER